MNLSAHDMIAVTATAERFARRARTPIIYRTRVGVFLALALCLVPASRTALAGVEEANATWLPAPSAAIRDKNVVKKRALVETSFGREGDSRKVQRVVTIQTSDAMRYFPDQFRVKKGHTVRLLVRNGGRVHHDLLLGTMDDLQKHAALDGRGGNTSHDGPNFARVAPGRTGRIDWHFTKAGEFYYGCLRPGHFEAGMIGTIIVR